MKGTIFAVALNHGSQLDAWREAFQQAPYKTPPKTAVWFIKPRNTAIGSGDAIPHPQGETVQSGATVALIVGKNRPRRLRRRGCLLHRRLRAGQRRQPAGRELLPPGDQGEMPRRFLPAG
ncbi:Homoprotocatechuate catabolism bifunctional isomerase/decarboxylase [Raoultella terrigena]|nr:Homoprotocatechuate catabolism bifunctional isomerase/decarboxylase [Raoultella terrigena]